MLINTIKFKGVTWTLPRLDSMLDVMSEEKEELAVMEFGEIEIECFGRDNRLITYKV